jgi:hypothetical protein
MIRYPPVRHPNDVGVGRDIAFPELVFPEAAKFASARTSASLRLSGKQQSGHQPEFA